MHNVTACEAGLSAGACWGNHHPGLYWIILLSHRDLDLTSPHLLPHPFNFSQDNPTTRQYHWTPESELTFNSSSIIHEPTYCRSDYQRYACVDAFLHTVQLYHLQQTCLFVIHITTIHSLSVPVQSIVWKTCLWNDLLCVKCDIKLYTLNQ